jgi:hypothetical protein
VARTIPDHTLRFDHGKFRVILENWERRDGDGVRAACIHAQRCRHGLHLGRRRKDAKKQLLGLGLDCAQV